MGEKKGSFSAFMSALSQKARKMLKRDAEDDDFLLTNSNEEDNEFERLVKIERPAKVEASRTYMPSGALRDPVKPESFIQPEKTELPEKVELPEIVDEPKPIVIEEPTTPEPAVEETDTWQRGMEQCNHTVDLFLKLTDTPHSSMSSRILSNYMIACRTYFKLTDCSLDYYTYAEEYFKKEMQKTDSQSDRKEYEAALKFLPVLSKESDHQVLITWIKKEYPTA